MAIHIPDNIAQTLYPQIKIEPETYTTAYSSRLFPEKILAGQILRLYMLLESPSIREIITTDVVRNETSTEIYYTYKAISGGLKAAFAEIGQNGHFSDEHELPTIASGFITLAARESPVPFLEYEVASLYETYAHPKGD